MFGDLLGSILWGIELTCIDKINKIARYSLIDTKYLQMAFQSAR